MNLEQEEKIIKFCRPYANYHWAAMILSIVLNCDFRDVNAALKEWDEGQEALARIAAGEPNYD